MGEPYPQFNGGPKPYLKEPIVLGKPQPWPGVIHQSDERDISEPQEKKHRSGWSQGLQEIEVGISVVPPGGLTHRSLKGPLEAGQLI